jgi:polar amino acid transport system permease protein
MLNLLASGAGVTLRIAIAASVLALLLAIPLGLARRSSRRWIRIPAVIYIEFFRGTSLMVQLFWLYFVLPTMGIRMEAMTAAIMGISLNYAAYGAEIVRGALGSVANGQSMAAKALGLSPWLELRLVIAPQAMTVFVRPWGNLMIQLLKATSLVSLITIADLTYRAYQYHQLTMQTFQVFGWVMVFYFLLAQAVARLTNWVDRHFSRWRVCEVNRG